ncbi:hypothetical protein PC121_g21504 [Phytophthora cactorum]|nr:hypothetical protein PC121_g21504 [Phytophthora cactorum]
MVEVDVVKLQTDLAVANALLKEAKQALEDGKQALEDANDRHERQLKEANERLKEAQDDLKDNLKDEKDRHERRLRAMDVSYRRQLIEANERHERQLNQANERLLAHATYALDKVTQLRDKSQPVLERTIEALNSTKAISYGCQGRLKLGPGVATLDIVHGPPHRIRSTFEDSIEKFVSRSVDDIARVTELIKVPCKEDVPTFSTKVATHVQKVWKRHKRDFPNPGVTVSFFTNWTIKIESTRGKKGKAFMFVVGFLSGAMKEAFESQNEFAPMVEKLSMDLDEVSISHNEIMAEMKTEKDDMESKTQVPLLIY